jgi:hypothetical protein
MSRLSIWQCYALAGLVILAGLLAIAALERAPYERQETQRDRVTW